MSEESSAPARAPELAWHYRNIGTLQFSGWNLWRDYHATTVLALLSCQLPRSYHIPSSSSPPAYCDHPAVEKPLSACTELPQVAAEPLKSLTSLLSLRRSPRSHASACLEQCPCACSRCVVRSTGTRPQQGMETSLNSTSGCQTAKHICEGRRNPRHLCANV